jgi:hypothetical protein
VVEMVSILFRSLDSEGEAELNSASKHFRTERVVCKLNPIYDYKESGAQLIIGRYSVLPYYKEVEDNLAAFGCRLVNNYAQHRFIAEFEYYEHIKDLTAETFEFGSLDWAKVPDEGSWVVKGATNSMKWLWNTRMFAKDKYTANDIAVELKRDSMIGQQKILMRRYLPFRKLAEGINGLPILNEWRCFYLYGRLVDMGFYWATHEELCLRRDVFCPPSGFEVVEKAAKRLAPYVNFFAIDVAELEDGTWKVVEVNDGQMAGLSCIDPDEFYQNLREATGV